jgi:hypothetical protein
MTRWPRSPNWAGPYAAQDAKCGSPKPEMAPTRTADTTVLTILRPVETRLRRPLQLPLGDAAPGMLSISVRGSSEGLDAGDSVGSEDSHRAKSCTKPVAQHQQAAREFSHLAVRAHYRYASCQIFHPRRFHRPPEPGPVARSECIRHDEVKTLAKRGRRAMAEQNLGTGTPPRNGPVRIGDDEWRDPSRHLFCTVVEPRYVTSGSAAAHASAADTRPAGGLGDEPPDPARPAECHPA